MSGCLIGRWRGEARLGEFRGRALDADRWCLQGDLFRSGEATWVLDCGVVCGISFDLLVESDCRGRCSAILGSAERIPIGRVAWWWTPSAITRR